MALAEDTMTKLKIFFTLIAALLLLIGTGTAKDIYKWVDENGVLHFQDTPPQNATQPVTVESVRTYEDNPRNALKPKQKSGKSNPASKTTPSLLKQSEKSNTPPKVELYVTSWCPSCKKARAFFKSKGIPFTEYDIEKDKDAARRKQQLTKTSGVPFALINGIPVLGFSTVAYKRALRGER
jgi:glutaredoxin